MNRWFRSGQVPKVWMLGVSPQMRGGIAAVVSSLLDGGLGSRASLHYQNTYSDAGSSAKLAFFLAATLRLSFHLARGKVVLVHAHVASNRSFWRKSLLLALVRGFGVPTIFHLHGGGFSDFASGLRWAWMRSWVRHSLESSDRVVVLSPRWQQWVQQFAPAARVEVIPNPVRVPDDSELASIRAERAPDAPRSALYLGLISDAKGCFDLLQAWPGFDAVVPGWRLRVGGNGESERLVAQASRMGVAGSLDYLGWVTGVRKQVVIAAADIFVLPSYTEGMPVSVLEAMAHGVAVVCTPVGGVPDILDHEVEGLLVAPGDTAALTSAMLRLAKSPALREAMGAAGRRRVIAHHGVPTVVARWTGLYEQLQREHNDHACGQPGGDVTSAAASGNVQRLKWLARRLSRMYAREVPHRMLAACQVLLATRGLIGARGLPRRASDARFGRRWTAGMPPAHGRSATLAAARLLMQGRLRVFGNDVDVHPDRINWNADPVTGFALPRRFGLLIDFRHLGRGVDIKYLWEVNRHLWWVTLAQSWSLTGDRVWLDALARSMRGWLVQCPHPLGPNWSSPVEHGIRLINWSLVWGLAGGHDSPMFEGPEGQRLRDDWLGSVYWHIRFIARNYSLYSSANNHLIGEAAGLFVAVHTWDLWADCRPLRDRARQVLEAEAVRQFHADGVNAEQAMCYHKFTLQFLVAAGLCGRANGDDLSASYWSRVESAITYIASQMTCRGDMPMYGDADEGAVYCLDPSEGFDPYRSLIALGASLFARPDLAAKLAAVSSRPDSQSEWLTAQPLPPDTAAGTQASMSSERLRDLPTRFTDGGYLILGDRLHSAQETRIVIDVGPLGSNKIAGHGHADALSVQLWRGGQSVLCDAGTFCYNAEPKFRRYFRSTSAHNTLQVDGQDQALYGGSFLWLSDVNSQVLALEDDGRIQSVHASHDGYARLADPVTHHRKLTYDAASRTLQVIDWLECRRPHQVSLGWHFPPGAVCSAIDDRQLVINIGTVRTRLRVRSQSSVELSMIAGATDPIQGWHSSRFYHREPAGTLMARATLSPRQQIETTILLD